MQILGRHLQVMVAGIAAVVMMATLPNPVQSFSTAPFGRRLAVVNTEGRHEASLCFVQQQQQLSFSQRRPRHQIFLGAKKKADKQAADIDDDDDDIVDGEWEPNEKDILKNAEEIDVNDPNILGDDDIASDVLVISDFDSEAVTPKVVAETDDDDDGDDDDLDIEWEDEDDEEYIGDSEGSNGPVGEEDSEEAYEYGFEGDYDIEDEDFQVMPLEDNPDDPDYQSQKDMVEATVERRRKTINPSNFDPVDYIVNQMTPEEHKAMEKIPFIKEVQEYGEGVEMIEESDLEGIDIIKEMEKSSDYMVDDPYPNEGKENIMGTGVSDDMMEQLDVAWKKLHKATTTAPWDKLMVKASTELSDLSNETVQEMSDCLDEVGGSAYNVTRWLLYDLDFNVTNLMLSAIQHNSKAPILFQHWYPQLLTYARYKDIRDRGFNFNWDDVNNADISELETYYEGFGYPQIPSKAPAETGIISLEPLDEDEIKMAALQTWMLEVYNPEWDRKDFDDDDLRDEDNVFSDYFEMPQHPDLPTYEDGQDDLRVWHDEFEEEAGDEDGNLSKEDIEYRDHFGKEFEFEVTKDDEFTREFRGHLIVACSGEDHDLEVAEKITNKMGEKFGKKVYVETRLMAHAREEDNVFEVWLESYEIELLHSKRRASSGTKNWSGPAECDDDQIKYLLDKVEYLISDDCRFSYSMTVDVPV